MKNPKNIIVTAIIAVFVTGGFSSCLAQQPQQPQQPKKPQAPTSAPVQPKNIHPVKTSGFKNQGPWWVSKMSLEDYLKLCRGRDNK
ncbi:MAG: hypothetical protein WCO09_04730 [bacterium]